MRPPDIRDARLWREDRHLAGTVRRRNDREIITEALDDEETE